MDNGGFSVHFVLGFQENFIYILKLCFKILQNSAKFIQKLTPGFKNQMRDWQAEFQNVEVRWATLSKKYI